MCVPCAIVVMGTLKAKIIVKDERLEELKKLDTVAASDFLISFCLAPGCFVCHSKDKRSASGRIGILLQQR